MEYIIIKDGPGVEHPAPGVTVSQNDTGYQYIIDRTVVFGGDRFVTTAEYDPKQEQWFVNVYVAEHPDDFESGLTELARSRSEGLATALGSALLDGAWMQDAERAAVRQQAELN